MTEGTKVNRILDSITQEVKQLEGMYPAQQKKAVLDIIQKHKMQPADDDS